MANRSARVWVLPTALLIIGIALAVPKFMAMATEGGQSSGGGRQSSPTAVRVVNVDPQTLEDKLVLNGSLAGGESITVRAEIVGRVIRVLFSEGSEVTRGQVLVELDDAELRAEKAALETELRLAEENYRRQRRLREQGLTPEESYDQALSRRNVLETRIELIDARLAKTVIKAPFSGVIGLRNVSPGELIDRDIPIANLDVVSTLKLTFGLPEVYQSRLRRDQPVELTVAGVDERFSGEVYAWDPRIDEVSRTIRVRALVDNPERKLLPGNFATVELALETIDDALMVPSTALVRGLDRNKVYVMEDGKAVERTVQVGLRTDEEVQITSGLKAGDRVIYLGVQSLRDGQQVAVAEESRTPDGLRPGNVDDRQG